MSKRFTGPVAILIIIQFLVMVGFGIVIPILPFFVKNLGGGALSVGLFMSAYSIMQFFFAPMWGRLSDRIGRRPVLLIGLCGYGLTFIAFGLVDKIYLLIAIRALSGMVSSATLPTTMAYLADVTEGSERSRGMGFLGAAAGMGMIFGPALGGWLGHYSFSLPFFAAGGLALLLIPFTYMALPESHKERDAAGTTSSPARRRLSWDVVRDPLLALYAFNFILNFTMAMFETTFALLAAAKVGFNSADMGTLFAVMGIFGVIVQGGLIAPLVKNFGDAKLVIVGSLICAAGMLAIILAADSGYHMLLVAAPVVFIIGNSLITPTSSSLVTKKSTQGQGASLGYFASFGSLGRILGPVTGGALYGLSMGLPYFSGAALFLLVLLLAGKKLGEIKEPQVQQ